MGLTRLVGERGCVERGPAAVRVVGDRPALLRPVAWRSRPRGLGRIVAEDDLAELGQLLLLLGDRLATHRVGEPVEHREGGEAVTSRTPRVFSRIGQPVQCCISVAVRSSNVTVPGGGPEMSLARVDVDAILDEDVEAVEAARSRPVALLADDRVLRSVAEALEPLARVAQLRHLAAEVDALAVEGHDGAIGRRKVRRDVGARIGDRQRRVVRDEAIRVLRDARLGGRHVDEEEVRLVVDVRQPVLPLGAMLMSSAEPSDDGAEALGQVGPEEGEGAAEELER